MQKAWKKVMWWWSRANNACNATEHPCACLTFPAGVDKRARVVVQGAVVRLRAVLRQRPPRWQVQVLLWPHLRQPWSWLLRDGHPWLLCKGRTPVW